MLTKNSDKKNTQMYQGIWAGGKWICYEWLFICHTSVAMMIRIM